MESIINEIMNDPILIGILILVLVFLIYSILKKLFKMFSIILVVIILYLLYLTQIVGVSYKEATNQTKNVGKELFEEGKRKINDYKEEIIKNQGVAKW